MDEKLKDTARQIMVGYAEHLKNISAPRVYAWGNQCAESIEQAFRDAGWQPPQLETIGAKPQKAAEPKIKKIMRQINEYDRTHGDYEVHTWAGRYSSNNPHQR
jgi:hypothetical protein